MNLLCSYLLLCILIITTKQDTDINKNVTKTVTLRTVRDIEQNMIFNDIKHSRDHFDEVYNIYNLLVPNLLSPARYKTMSML